MSNLETVPIDNSSNYHRDIKTHAIININDSEYDSYMRRKELLAKAKEDAQIQASVIDTLRKDLDSLQNIVSQLINRDLNGTSTKNK